jgi:Protein of unknown function (DUF1552)
MTMTPRGSKPGFARFGRRRFLQTAGLTSGSLFLPSLFGDRAAYAQAMPKRLVVFYTQHGPVTGKWELRPTGMAATPDAEWELPLGPLAQTDFTDTLAPLYANRNDLLVLEGLALTSAIADKQGNNHAVAGAHHFTGAMDGSQHVSFDQYVADQVAVPGRFKYLGFPPNAGDVDNAGFYDTAGNPVTLARTDNYYGFLGNQFARVFDGLSSGMTTMMPAKPTGMDLSRARRQVSVEFVRGQYAKAMAKLGADDRMKLSLHRDMLEDLALRVQSVSQIMCTKPTYPAKGSQTDIEIANILMTQLLPVAMACDLTRVGQVGHTQLRAVDLGAPSTLDVHQDIAHQAADINSQAAMWMVNYHKIHAQQFAGMISAFKAVPEGSGTMLDNTILIWMNELANGGHDLFRMMYVMAGGKNLGLRPGRYLKYAETGPNPYNLLKTSPYGDTPGGNYGSDKFGLGPAHSQLLVSIMQAFGVNRSSIGLAAATGTGYMTGAPITMTGPLPRLT